MDIYNLDTENLEHLKLKDIGKNIKKAVSNVKTKVKDTAIKVKQAVNTVADKAKELAKKGVNASLYIPLLPLRVIMEKALKNKGVQNPPKDIGELAFMFHKRIIKGENTYSFDEASLYNSDNVDNYNHIDPATITVIVTAIIQWVKKIKEKKDNNKPLDKEEQVVAEKIDEVEKELDQKIETANAPKNWFKDNLPLILVVGAVIVFLIVRKK